jgi:two-component system response regulator CpxR
MAKYKILLIDDDIELAALLTDYLASEGFELVCCDNGVSGLAQAFDQSIDLILLDVMMPQLDGFEVLKALGGNHRVPILMITAKGDHSDRILGLELGADDYLTKPFHHRELLARIKATLRRIEVTQQHVTSGPQTVNNISLNHGVREALCHGQKLELTGTEYQMLAQLITLAGEIVSKADLFQKVLGRRASLHDRSVDMHISNIRRKILTCCGEEKIKTIRNAGYLFLKGD